MGKPGGLSVPALNFQKRFVQLINSGHKTSTIRPERKRPIRVEDRLLLYTGMRTAQCRKLADAVCIAVDRVEITETTVHIAGVEQEIHTFAQRDGFRNTLDMLSWFKKTHRLPFRGYIITWHKYGQ